MGINPNHPKIENLIEIHTECCVHRFSYEIHLEFRDSIDSEDASIFDFVHNRKYNRIESLYYRLIIFGSVAMGT